MGKIYDMNGKKMTPKMENLLKSLPSGWVHLYGKGVSIKETNPDLDFNSNTLHGLWRRGLVEGKWVGEQLYVRRKDI